ncbi:MAG TPA: SRPBCC family protein [Microbacterium sp.]|nr:SRPBCC family protein [Microbacterium sp.]
MATNRRFMRCTPEAVFTVLGNGWLYPAWVVGAARMRDVDAAWPAPASTLEHSVGTWPFLLNGDTSMLEWRPPRRAVMQARGWPLGEAKVILDVERRDGGCEVRIREWAVKGAGAALPRFLTDPLLRWRNNETLRRLSYLSEGQSSASSASPGGAGEG